MNNFFSQIPSSSAVELMQTLLDRDGVRVERIVSHGQSSPPGYWYDQVENEWVLLLQGAAKLRFADSDIEMRPGDFVDIPAHKKHRVEWTTPDEHTIWLAIFYPSCSGSAAKQC